MTAQTKLSAKGQVVIPKDVRDRLGWLQGSELEVIETSEGVILRRPRPASKLTADEALARIHSRGHRRGLPIPIEELGFSAEAYREWLETQR